MTVSRLQIDALPTSWEQGAEPGWFRATALPARGATWSRVRAFEPLDRNPDYLLDRVGARREGPLGRPEVVSLPEPLDDIGLMLDLADNVLVSTEVVPVPAPSPPNWWYYAVKGGQHISFYAADSLQKIASHFHVHLLSRGSYHLFTRKPQNSLLFRIATSAQTVPIVNWLRKRESLIQADFERMAA